MQTSFHPIIHISVSVLCIHESTNTLICAVTFKSFTHILIFPSNCSSIHPSTFSFGRYLFILIPLSTNASLRVFHPHIFPDRQIPTHISFIYLPIYHSSREHRLLIQGPEFGSQHSHRAPNHPVSGGSDALLWTPPLHSSCHLSTYSKLILLKSQGIHQSSTQVISSTVFMM